jgi:hypothetical protein
MKRQNAFTGRTQESERESATKYFARLLSFGTFLWNWTLSLEIGEFHLEFGGFHWNLEVFTRIWRFSLEFGGSHWNLEVFTGI